MKIALKKYMHRYLVFFLFIILLCQILSVNGIVAAISENENIAIQDEDYLIYTNDLMINEYSATVNGSVYSSGDTEYTGTQNCIINGTINSYKTIQDNIKYNHALSVNQVIPDLTNQIIDVDYESNYTSNTMLSGEEYNLEESSITVDGDLFLDQITLKNTGYIKASNNIQYNAVNDGENDYTFLLYSENGDITIQGSNIVLNGIIYAPNGKIELNAKNLTINGIIISDRVEFNGTELNINPLANDEILNYQPQLDIQVGGEQKENRKLILDISQNENIAKFVKDQTVWSITALDGSGEQMVFIDEDNSDAYTKELIIKKHGDYLVQVTASSVNQSYTYEKVISITEDIEPVANIVSDDTFFRGLDQNQALIHARDISYSTDFDDIQNRIWTIVFDSDNDGDFDDEQEIVISQENESEISYLVSHVGKYKIGLKVREHFTNTIEQFIDEDDYLTAYVEKIVIVDNMAPQTNLNIEKAKHIDLVFTASTTDTAKINEYNKKIENIKSNLENNGFTVSLSAVKTSTLTAQDTFAWTEYDHINYRDQYAPSLPKHILYQGNNIVMKGYGSPAFKDFLFVKDDNPSQKILSFNIQRDNSNWHTIEGGGFLFNASVDQELTGYCILLTQNGLRLIYLDRVNVANFRNGNPSFVQNAGIVLATANVGNVLASHSLKIIADSKTISVWDNGRLVIDNFVLPFQSKGYGYGPITSHTSHACSQQSYFTFGNIKMQTIEGNSLSSALEDYNWTSDQNRYLINLSDTIVQDLNGDTKMIETAKSLLEQDIKFIGIGSGPSMNQYQSLLQSAEGVSFSSDDSNFAAENMENYILSSALKNDYTINKYITTDDKLVYTTNYSDNENDPVYSSVFQYNYDATVFESGNANEPTNIEKSEPITKFDNTGSYNISLRVQDNPANSNDFDEYRKWSDTDNFEKTLYVHTRPTAVLNTQVYPDHNDTTKFIVQAEENSFDLDHMNADDKGISDKKYAWKKMSDHEWTDGMIPEKIEANTVYFLKLVVCDKEGKWSRPCISVISSNQVKSNSIDQETPEISLLSSSDDLSIEDRLSIESSVLDNISGTPTEPYTDDGLVSSVPATCIFDYVKVFAENIFVNKDIRNQQPKVLERDDIDKQIQDKDISFTEDCKVLRGTVKLLGKVNDIDIDHYHLMYKKQGDEVFIEPQTNKDDNGFVELDTTQLDNGIYTIRFLFIGPSGNEVLTDMIVEIKNEQSFVSDIVSPSVIVLTV